jgi:hypothetical protein
MVAAKPNRRFGRPLKAESRNAGMGVAHHILLKPVLRFVIVHRAGASSFFREASLDRDREASVSDNLEKRRPEDPKRINVTESWELKY